PQKRQHTHLRRNEKRVCGSIISHIGSEAVRIAVITGPMFAGKSDELIRRLERYSASGERVSVFVHADGVHHISGHVRARSGREFPAKPVNTLYEAEPGRA